LALPVDSKRDLMFVAIWHQAEHSKSARRAGEFGFASPIKQIGRCNARARFPAAAVYRRVDSILSA